MSSQFNQLISGKFPYFSKEEQAVIGEVLVQSNSPTPGAKQAQDSLLDIIYHDLVSFHQWDLPLDKRVDLRKRLLNLAGLFCVVPVEKLRELAGKARLTQKKTMGDTPPDPIQNDFIECNSFDIKYISYLKDFLERVDLSQDMTALDFVSGNRDRNHYPHSQFTVFRKRIQDEVLSKDYLTASAEPLTQTVMISLYNPGETVRDLITIGFDMVYESAFIDFFHHAPNPSPISLPRNAHLVARNYLLSVINLYIGLKRSGKDILKALPVFIASTEKNEQHLHNLVLFLTDTLLPQVEQKIQKWNVQLGLAENHDQIEWPKKP